MSDATIRSIEAEYRRYKVLAESALAQLDDEALCRPGEGGGNSIATVMWHVAGNLESRFTDFRTTDGEKPWRHRDDEFAPRTVSRDVLLDKWEAGWRALLSALSALSDSDLSVSVTIRRQPLRIDEALHRSLAHTSYHVGQIVYLAKSMRGRDWQYLSIPPGKSAAYNEAPVLDKPPADSIQPPPTTTSSS